MRKLLLFFTLCLTSLGSWAAEPTTSTEDDGKTLVITSDNATDFATWWNANITSVNAGGYTKIRFVGQFGSFSKLQGTSADLPETLNVPVIDVTGVKDIYGERQLTNSNIKAVIYGIGTLGPITANGPTDYILVDAATGTATATLDGSGSLGAYADYIGTLNKLTVSGTLSSADASALNAKVVDLHGVTTNNASITDFAGSVEYLFLPDGYTTSNMASLSTTNLPNIKSAGSEATLTGQEVPGWDYEVTTSTVTKYYTDDVTFQDEYTANDMFEQDGSWYGTGHNYLEQQVTTVSEEQTYTDTWANNKAYPVGTETVTDGKVTPSEFAVKLDYKWVDEYNNQVYPNESDIQQDANGYYYMTWDNNAQITVYSDGDGGWFYDEELNNRCWPGNQPQEDGSGGYYIVGGNVKIYISKSFSYKLRDQWGNETGDPIEYTDSVTVEDGTSYGTITNPGEVSFDVATTYTYSYEDCDGITQTFTSQTAMTTYQIDCTTTIHLYAHDVEVQTVAENASPTTLKNQTLEQLSIYTFVNGESQNFAYNMNLVTTTHDSVTGYDKLCMAGNDLGYGDLANKKEEGLWVGVKYFDFTGSTFEDITLSTPIMSSDEYNGTLDLSECDHTDQTYDTQTNTNAFYYFNLNCGTAFTCLLPTGNTEIPPMTFYNGGGGTDYTNQGSPLLEINIPNSYTSIGFEAFKYTKIQTLYIPGSITSVGDGAFVGCNYLENVEMGASNSSCTFGEKTFMTCTALKFFTMAEGVRNLPYMMFNTCANLENIRIPSTCKTIGSYAFQYCTQLHAVTIPEGVESLGVHVFNLSGVTDIYIMATSFDKIPAIYDTGIDGNMCGTFSQKDIRGNNTAPQGKVTNNDGITSQSQHLGYFNETSEEVRQEYQENFSNSYLGDQNCLIAIHYPDAMKWFYDGVPGFESNTNGEGVSDRRTYADITSGGTQIWSYFPEEKRWNYQEDVDGTKYKTFSSAYQYDDRNVKNHGGDTNHTWPSQSDMSIRLKTGGSVNATMHATPSAYGWRQFSLMSSDVEQGTEIFQRDYDDTWYTMCFPWRMSDDQLFESFNQKCEITEFKGAEVVQTDTYEYSLVLHFDEVASTYYLAKGTSNVYERENDGTYDVELASGETITLKKYKYTLLDSDGNPTSTVITFSTGSTLTDEQKKMNAIYYSIENIMVKEGHPYMIHPSNGAKPGQPATVNITGVKRVATTDEELAALETAGQVTKAATTGDAETTFTSPLGGGGNYIFHGYLGRGIEEDGYDQKNDYADIPQKSYFLATKAGETYPKYYRKMAAGTKRWTLFTAIITPDADALANIEALDGHVVTGEANVAFGEWEQVDVTAIEQIIADAEQKGEEVREVHLNVVYNVNGQVVRTDGQVEGLPRGLYIVNGKKYMVK